LQTDKTEKKKSKGHEHEKSKKKAKMCLITKNICGSNTLCGARNVKDYVAWWWCGVAVTVLGTSVKLFYVKPVI